MAEWNENKLEQELETLAEEMPAQADLEQKIQQSITRRIKRIAGVTALAVLLAVATLFLCISPLMNLMFWDPTDEDEKGRPLVFFVLRDYWETTTPYVDLIRMQVEKKGFGCYRLAIEATNHREALHVGTTDLWIDVNRGNYENRQDAKGYFTHQTGRFMFRINAEEKAELLNELQKLPQSAHVYLSVAGAQPRGIEELRNETVDLLWVQVYQPNVEWQGGLSMRLTDAYDKDDVSGILNDKELLEVYRSNLKNMLEHPKVWKDFYLPDGGDTVYTAASGVLEKTYEDAQNLETLMVKNYCVSGTRDEIIEYLQCTDVTSVKVDEVILSKWSY